VGLLEAEVAFYECGNFISDRQSDIVEVGLGERGLAVQIADFAFSQNFVVLSQEQEQIEKLTVV
jgi:hypothetical protein